MSFVMLTYADDAARLRRRAVDVAVGGVLVGADALTVIDVRWSGATTGGRMVATVSCRCSLMLVKVLLALFERASQLAPRSK